MFVCDSYELKVERNGALQSRDFRNFIRFFVIFSLFFTFIHALSRLFFREKDVFPQYGPFTFVFMRNIMHRLFYFPSCPFCQKVLKFCEENRVELSLCNTRENSDYREELIRKGGKGQVPALEIEGKILYESNEIINYLSQSR